MNTTIILHKEKGLEVGWPLTILFCLVTGARSRRYLRLDYAALFLGSVSRIQYQRIVQYGP